MEANPTEEPSVLKARKALRDAQWAEVVRAGGGTAAKSGTTTPATLAALQWRRKFEPSSDPRLVRRGVMNYPKELEEQRITLAEQLVRRTDPGPFEDANYLSLLAYQAASVQMAIPLVVPGADPKDPAWSRYLLGTLPTVDTTAFAKISKVDHLSIILVGAGLVDFIYQFAKCVIAAQMPRKGVVKDAFVSATTQLDVIRAGLDADKGPVDRMYETLEAQLYDGLSRASQNETVPEEQHPPLAILIGLAERFVIAHEYGHAQTLAGMPKPPPDVNGAWVAELLADMHGMFTTVLSARKLDILPPEFALAGAAFALRCLDLQQRAVSLARHGRVPHVTPPGDSPTHPPIEFRIERLFQSFERYFDAEYETYRLRSLVLRTNRDEAPPQTPQQRAQIRGVAEAYGAILQLLWERVQPRLEADFARGRPLHPKWAGA